MPYKQDVDMSGVLETFLGASVGQLFSITVLLVILKYTGVLAWVKEMVKKNGSEKQKKVDPTPAQLLLQEVVDKLKEISQEVREGNKRSAEMGIEMITLIKTMHDDIRSSSRS